MTKHINGQAGKQGVTDLQRRIACLRKRIGELENCVKRRNDEIHELRVTNANLRMLIDLKQTCWKYVGWCSECPYNGLDDEHDDCNCTVREKVNSLARELGIEVDE